jgi:HEAT repeat protein
MRKSSATLTAAALLCALSGAEAQSDGRASLPATPKQHALAVAIARDGDRVVGLRAEACSTAPCDASGADLVPFADDVNGAAATVETIQLAAGRHVALLRAPTREGAGSFVAILWPSDRGQAPVVNTLSGHFDAPKSGVEGERKSTVLIREPVAGGERLLVGTRYENVSVCERPAVMALKWLDPTTMQWTPVGARALEESERKGAVALDARPVAHEQRASAPRVLSPRLASSAVDRSVKHAADRDPATRWAEAKPGNGAGEFVVMNAAHEVPIEAFEIVVRGREAPGTAPKTFFIALPKAVYRVTMPDDAMTRPVGSVYEIVLPEPVETDCVTFVLDEAFGDGEVGFAEIRARTRYDEQTPESLVAALEGDDRFAAKALLLRGGPEATEAAMKGYDDLGEEGQAGALEVIDAGPCDLTTRFYAALVVGEGRGKDFNPALDRLAGHARDRLRACRTLAVETLSAMIAEAGPGQRRVWAARELVDLDPGGSITTILDVLSDGSKAPAAPGGDDAVRRGLRGALAIAARHRRAQDAVDAALAEPAFASRSLVDQIDLLRAIGPGLVDHARSGPALAQILANDKSFRTRYLLVPPAAVLARGGHAASLELLKQSFADTEPALRAHAATESRIVPALGETLSRALGDDNPRVRTAALSSLAAAPGAIDLGPRIIPLLQGDPWTFVRGAAAAALGGMPRSKATDEALVAAIDDSSPIVRRSALRAIGRRGQSEAGSRVHDVADDARQTIDTRTAAIAALGELCRHDSIDLLTKLALRAGFQQLPYDEPLGMAALDALGNLHPPDLRERLAPLLSPNARIPVPIRRIARAVLLRPGRCGGST